MTETPRTDAEESAKMNMPGTVLADFARDLERENAKLRESVEIIRAAWAAMDGTAAKELAVEDAIMAAKKL